MVQQTSTSNEISLGKKFGAVVVNVNGISLEISSDGTRVEIISDKPIYVDNVVIPKPISITGQALKVGDHLQNGTVVISVDPKNETALFAPEGIFGGNSEFDKQDDVVKQANDQALHGNKDWRRITDEEASALADAWDKVAPRELRRNAAPWFWGASPYRDSGRIYSRERSNAGSFGDVRPVPVVRSGPARS